MASNNMHTTMGNENTGGGPTMGKSGYSGKGLPKRQASIKKGKGTNWRNFDNRTSNPTKSFHAPHGESPGGALGVNPKPKRGGNITGGMGGTPC